MFRSVVGIRRVGEVLEVEVGVRIGLRPDPFEERDVVRAVVQLRGEVVDRREPATRFGDDALQQGSEAGVV